MEVVKRNSSRNLLGHEVSTRKMLLGFNNNKSSSGSERMSFIKIISSQECTPVKAAVI